MARLFRFGDIAPPARSTRPLPPGQREISTFPRYGAHFSQRDPDLPEHPAIEVSGPAGVRFELDAAALEDLPRTDVVADFHCVARWTARDLHWEGVRLHDLYEDVVRRAGAAGAAITHVRAAGRDGYRSVLVLEDALRDDVLVADRLGGEPLPPEHGAPFRLLSPTQYGYKSVKWLRGLEFHTEEPSDLPEGLLASLPLRVAGAHPRARVEHEERHKALPAWAVRTFNIRVVHPLAYTLGYLGARRSGRR